MRAMILAAGLGERMGNLVRDIPKPLLKVNGRPLIEYAIANLKRAGIFNIVINVHYHADQIQQYLGDGHQYGCHIEYSIESERLEVGGGIIQALPLLGDEPFIVISSDVICDYPLSALPISLAPNHLAHFILVDNPPFHPAGDFGLRNGTVSFHESVRYNYAGIGLYHPELFFHQKPGFFAWKSILFPVIENHQIQGEYYSGLWFNVGTSEELASANDFFKQHHSQFQHFNPF